jgi:hypothetical protein
MPAGSGDGRLAGAAGGCRAGRRRQGQVPGNKRIAGSWADRVGCDAAMQPRLDLSLRQSLDCNIQPKLAKLIFYSHLQTPNSFGTMTSDLIAKRHANASTPRTMEARLSLNKTANASIGVGKERQTGRSEKFSLFRRKPENPT